MRRITRRQALVGGAGAVVAGGVGIGGGRYALGDTFEQHVADTIGLPLGLTKQLLERMRAQVGGYDTRAAGYLAATTFPGRDTLPESVRRQAVESFIGPLVDIDQAFVTPQVYVGIKNRGRFEACTAIARPDGRRA